MFTFLMGKKKIQNKFKFDCVVKIRLMERVFWELYPPWIEKLTWVVFEPIANDLGFSALPLSYNISWLLTKELKSHLASSHP